MLQGSPRNLLGFKGAVGGSLFTAISHGRIGDVVQTSHTLGKETVQWRHLYVASDCRNPDSQSSAFPSYSFFFLTMSDSSAISLLALAS